MFNDLCEVDAKLPIASDLLKTFLNFNLDDSGISFLHCFPSRTNLKLHNISVTTKMVKKVITNLDFPKASTPNCILQWWF